MIVEGTAAATNADALVYDVMAALYTACSSFMAQNVGAGNKKRVLRSYFISLGFSFCAGALLGGGLVLFGQEFLSLFTTDAAVVEAGMVRLTVMGCSYAFSAFMDCTIAASRGLGKSVVPTVIVILGSCVFRVIWVYTVFAYFLCTFVPGRLPRRRRSFILRMFTGIKPLRRLLRPWRKSHERSCTDWHDESSQGEAL